MKNCKKNPRKELLSSGSTSSGFIGEIKKLYKYKCECSDYDSC